MYKDTAIRGGFLMMDFKSIHDRYQTYSSGGVKRTAEKAKTEGAAAAEGMAKENVSSDRVEISRDSMFKAQLDRQMRSFAEKFTSERVDALEKAYSGDECPVSSLDSANALMARLFGVNNVDLSEFEEENE